MNQTEELQLPKKLMLTMALLLTAAILMMLSGVTTHAAGSEETVEKNGLHYICLSEKDFKETFTKEAKDKDKPEYLTPSKYGAILSKIKENGGIYAWSGEYTGNSSSISVENTINGKPVMMVNSYPDKVKVLYIPENVVSLPNSRYISGNALTAINISKNNKYFTSLDGVVYNKKKTTLSYYPLGKKNKTYKMPKTVTQIEKSVLMRQKYIEKLVISDKVTNIPSYFGMGMTKLKSLHLPNKLKTIGNWAFEDCNKLKSVTIPATCKTISRAFYDCKSLKTVTIKSKKFSFDMDGGSSMNYTMVLKKGASITCPVNMEGMSCSQSKILSVKKQKDYLYTIKALNTGNATITWGSQKIKVKVVK